MREGWAGLSGSAWWPGEAYRTTILLAYLLDVFLFPAWSPDRASPVSQTPQPLGGEENVEESVPIPVSPSVVGLIRIELSLKGWKEASRASHTHQRYSVHVCKFEARVSLQNIAAYLLTGGPLYLTKFRPYLNFPVFSPPTYSLRCLLAALRLSSASPSPPLTASRSGSSRPICL
jgi:hypothetical protein